MTIAHIFSPFTIAKAPWRIAPPIHNDVFHSIRRKMMLDHCKWDSQIGDIQTLAAYPLIVHADAWKQLSDFAEALSAEVALAEEFLMRNRQWLSELGLPGAVRRLLGAENFVPVSTAARIIRYDFHWTTSGWRISEINSDVPGGYSEASSFSRLMAGEYSYASIAGDPAGAWVNALATTSNRGGHIALLSAPGFLEDQQITAYISGLLNERERHTHLANPTQLEWQDGAAFIRIDGSLAQLDSIVRFYQAEWLPGLPRCSGWEYMFSSGRTPVSNPGTAILTESKRFPSLLSKLPIELPECMKLFPRTRDPQEVNWKLDNSWMLKSALSNNGDSVGCAELLTDNKWRRLRRAAWWNPWAWVAQERFETITLDSPIGPVYPCVGVYTVDGKTAGAYGRISSKAIIDCEAIDIAVLIEQRK